MNPNITAAPLAVTTAMRLSAAQTEVILNCVRQQFGTDAQVMLFGSRLDDAAHGGDVDLLVETAARPTLHKRALATADFDAEFRRVCHRCMNSTLEAESP